MSNNQKTIIITGTRKGLGYALALHYISMGHIVCGCSREACDIDHPNYYHYTLDVSDEKAVVKMVKEINQKFKIINVLINNAGIASMNHILLTPSKTLRNVTATNFFGSFLFLREVAKTMCANYNKMKNSSTAPHFRIINFSTVAYPLRLEGEAIYSASKAAIVSLTQTSSYELGRYGITINAIGPTPAPTDLIKNVPKTKMDALINRQAIKRFANNEDIFNVCDFFIDEKSDFITGQVVYLGGING